MKTNRRRALVVTLLVGLALTAFTLITQLSAPAETVPATAVAGSLADGPLPATAAGPRPQRAASLPPPAPEQAEDPCRSGMPTAQALARDLALLGVLPEGAADRATEALARRARPEAAALAHLLALSGQADSVPFEPEPGKESCLTKGKPDDPCFQDLFKRHQTQRAQAASGGTDALAALALHTDRPLVYGLAFQACGGHHSTPHPAARCGQITPERWAQLDPDNATPWLHLASAAERRQDSAGVAEALHRASLARASRHLGGEWLAFLGPSLATLPEIDGLALAIRLIGIQAAWTSPDYRVLYRHCAQTAVADSNRRQTCEALAGVLGERSGHLVERMVATKLHGLLGSPPERQASLARENQLLNGGLMSAIGVTEPVKACAYTRQVVRHWTDAAGQGEVGMARAVIAESGLGPEAFMDAVQARLAAALASVPGSSAGTASAPAAEEVSRAAAPR